VNSFISCKDNSLIASYITHDFFFRRFVPILDLFVDFEAQTNHNILQDIESIKNEDKSFAGNWMKLENIILSEVSQAQKDKSDMFSLICGR
jgi:hypothetical protein